MNIEDLDLTIRSHNGLKAAGISTVQQLVKLDFNQLYDIKNIGKKSVAEICWQCIQLLNGRMTEQRIEFEKLFQPRPDDWKELKAKARKYDAIADIIVGLS